MHVFQTAGAPPRYGSNILATMGWIKKSNSPLRNHVSSNNNFIMTTFHRGLCLRVVRPCALRRNLYPSALTSNQQMDRTIILRKASLDNASLIKRAALLCAIWLLVSLTISFARVTHPAFGLEGDLSLHYHITRSYMRSFEEGDLLPRWAGLLDGGNGDAFFTFYPPLSYLLSAILMKVAGINALTSLKLVTVLIIFIAQAGAYRFARTFFNRRGSLVASVLYVALPAYSLISLKLSFFANAFALSFVPFALLGAHKLLIGKRHASGLTFFALGMSGIVLSHNITTYLCGIVFALMTLLYLQQVGWRGVARLVGAGFLVFALTAFFLIPLLTEMKWVRTGLQVDRHDYHDYFLFAKVQEGSQYRKMWSSLNLGVSYITVAQTSMTFLVCLVCLPILRKRSLLALPVSFGFAITTFTLIISSPWSNILWQYLPGLNFIQFPWRFLPFVSLGCGLVIAAAFTPQPDNQSSWRMLRPVHRALISFLLTWMGIANVYFTWTIVRMEASEITKEQVARLLDSPDVEKLPFDAMNRLDNRDDSLPNAYKANQYYFRPNTAELILYPPATEPGGLTLLTQQGQVKSQRLCNQQREFVVECKDPTKARIETYYYPHWIARLDGNEIPINLESETGRMLIDLPAGTHNLAIAFEPRNKIEIWAVRGSLLAWVLFIGWIIWKTAGLRPAPVSGKPRQSIRRPSGVEQIDNNQIGRE